MSKYLLLNFSINLWIKKNKQFKKIFKLFEPEKKINEDFLVFK